MPSAVGSNGNSFTGSFDLNTVSEKDAISGISDFIITYDASASVNKKVNLSNLNLTNYQKVIKTSAADTTTSSAVWSDVSGLEITLPINKTFLIRYYVILESTSATVAANCSINLGATHTIVTGAFVSQASDVYSRRTLTGDRTNSQTVNAMVQANLPLLYEMTMIIRSGASSGSIVPSFRSESGASTTITARTYSWGEAIQLD